MTGPGPSAVAAPLVELRGVGKSYGTIRALHDVDLTVRAGEVACVLGDNGAGKSTLIKIISGLHRHSEGELRIDGEPVRLGGPREALRRGIAAVYQDLATVTLMPVWRNFFLGSELTRGRWPFQWLDIPGMRRVADGELRAMGIALDDLDQPVGSLSGGQRQSVAIARAIHFGARVLILDEPTAALGVRQSGVVLKYIAAARERGLGVVLITHNPHHAHLVGDHFTVLRLGEVELSAPRADVTLDDLTLHMAGGAELAVLERELANGTTDSTADGTTDGTTDGTDGEDVTER
ncbi:ATP-binding cassette domain-containing protein [Streptomyces radicis]|uniref:Sugar ABC transporter ATP-binding protein n=1 Tax=Streptomyces radicis TaxID=1750517 RepID=A0A3A9W3P1_9ACTN|nr:ATP-binding cassette domain-containing protein [Streptomyces radicis]RKN07871.1 sugar ABC transporter ATP-binding protein [Streptomyces radicis]RKN20675.1 sugar ABC transporter ATP-binding protein [Streptomyces radicis]